jgi:hypothetical protein
MQMRWLKIGVLRRRTALPTPRAPNVLCRWLLSSTPDAHVEDYPLPDGIVCDGRTQYSSSHAKISWARYAILSRKCQAVEIIEMDVEMCVSVLVVEVGCPSSCQEIPGDDKGASDEDLGDGDGGAHGLYKGRKPRILQLLYSTDDDWIPTEVRIIFTVDIFLCFNFGSSFYFHFSWIDFWFPSSSSNKVSQYSRVHFMK